MRPFPPAQNQGQNQGQNEIDRRGPSGLSAVAGMIALSVIIIAFQNCGGSEGGGSANTSAAASAATGVVPLLPEPGLTNPRLQVISDDWTSHGQVSDHAKNLGCIDAFQNSFSACSAWSLVQWKQIVSQAPGALLSSGISLITDPGQLQAYGDPDWGTALLAILSVSADPVSGTPSTVLRAPDASGITVPGTLRIYHDAARSRFAYELTEQNGFINSTGGQIEALQASFLPVNGSAPTLLHPVVLSLYARIAAQHIAFYTNPADTMSVRSLFYSEASLGLTNPSGTVHSDNIKSLRMRFIHGDTANYTIPASTCIATDSGYEITVEQNLPNENIRYDLRAGSRLSTYQIDLNSHLCSILSLMLTCRGQVSGQSVSRNLTLESLPAAADPQNWSLLTEQTGLETSKAQAMASNQNASDSALGEISTRLQLENISATQDLSRTYVCPTHTSTRTLIQGAQTLREVCGYGAPRGTGWLVSSDGCYQKVVGDQSCVAGHLVKTACAVPNPGALWTPIGDECYSYTTNQACP